VDMVFPLVERFIAEQAEGIKAKHTKNSYLLAKIYVYSSHTSHRRLLWVRTNM
jgi:hypothetical protein